MEKTSNRICMSSASFFAVILLNLIKILSSGCKFVHAVDILLPGEYLSLSGTQSLLSKSHAFKLGFRCLFPPCQLDWRFGIWYMNLSTCSPLLVWEPDAVSSISPLSWSFGLSEVGELYLTKDGRSSVWSSLDTGIMSTSATAILLDNGNLVIRDQLNISMVFWQSFDNPVGILLPGGWLGFNRISGRNVSLISSASFGDDFSHSILQIDVKQSRGFVVRHIPSTYYTYSQEDYSDAFPSWMGIRESGDSFLLLNDAHLYVQLYDNGTVSTRKLEDCGSMLQPNSPDSGCDPDLHCSTDSICVVSYSPYYGTQWYCLRVAAPQCLSNASAKQDIYFHPMDQVRDVFPGYPLLMEVTGILECEAICSSNCSCTSYAFQMDGTCSLWFWELHKVVTNSFQRGVSLYVRKAKQENLNPRIGIIVLTVIGVLTLVLVCLVFLWRRKRKIFLERLGNSSNGPTIFSGAQIKKATRNFSEKLGEGGFGCVFKGTLPRTSAVAVKKLKDLGQGEKQFRAEVQTIGMIQHINLVRLFGYCAEGSKRLLVYEYMENGSLNSHLFPKSSVKLIWEIRYRIALGTARGLAYLHEECKDCIIHCDMKPDNVLLDADFCPKIADFGMAKLLGRDFSRALTTMRGTIGYLAPEWISGLPITRKSDVYSYGMMLLEIISGRRNSEKIKVGKFTYFPIFAALKVNEGDIMCLLDSRLEGAADVEQLGRACRVACWCIQDAEDHRPTMGQVVYMLEGVLDVEIPPIPRSLQNFVGMEDSTYSTDVYSL